MKKLVKFKSLNYKGKTSLIINDEVTVVAANHTKGKCGKRSVALFRSDFKDGNGEWMHQIPDWPCMAWYARLHDKIKAEAVSQRRFILK